MTELSIVYMATNLINGKRYIGVTSKTLARRSCQHQAHARRGVDTALCRALRKYGADMIRFRVVMFCASHGIALAEERRLVGSLRPEYNMTEGGEGVLGFKFSAQQRARLSESHKGLGLGVARPREVIEKVIATKRARGNLHPPPPAPASLAALAAGRQRASQRRQKPVVCLDDGESFVSGAAAAFRYGAHRSAICLVLTGKRKTASGRRFAYEIAG